METLLMGSIFVFALLTFLSYILIVLNIPYIIIPIVVFLCIWGFKRFYSHIKNVKIVWNLQTFIVLLVFLIGIIGQLAVIAPSGIYQNGDLIFWSAHGHDGTWHIALMEEIKKGYPFQNPIFSETKLTNYHFFSDILPAMISKYTGISDLNLYFRIFPAIYSFWLGISVYFLTKKITTNSNAPIWAVIFTYFAGSFGYLIGKGESVFWATQIQSSSGNPPQIVSNFLFLTAIYFVLTFLQNSDKSKQKLYFFISLILLGTISAFKIYAGVIILLTLGLIGTWNLIFKKDLRLFILTLFSGIIALALYLPNSSNSGSFLIYEPWWYIRTMIVEPSRLNLLDWELRRQTYIYEHNLKRVIWLEGMGFLIFFFGNLGMRFLGLWEFIRTNTIFKVSIVLSLVLPLLFLQKGVASNTAQFLQYFILLFGILSGIAISKIPKTFSYFLFPVIFALMIPTQVKLFKEFYISENHLRQPFTKVSKAELDALNFIKENTSINDVILTPPYNEYLNLKKPVPDIWDWFDTSYVSALTSRRTYFDDYEQVDIMGYDYKSRLETKKIIFDNLDATKISEALKSTNASILYYPKVVAPKVNPELLGLSKFFENSEVIIWKI